MVPMKAVLIISLILINMQEYNCTRSSKGMENLIDNSGDKLALTGKSIGSSTIQKHMYDGLPSVAQIDNLIVQGQKMPLRAPLDYKMGKNERLNGEKSRTLGSAHFVEKSKQKRNRNLNVVHKLLRRHSRHHKKHDTDHSFMAFSSDYNVPTRHPPRHN